MFGMVRRARVCARVGRVGRAREPGPSGSRRSAAAFRCQALHARAAVACSSSGIRSSAAKPPSTPRAATPPPVRDDAVVHTPAAPAHARGGRSAGGQPSPSPLVVVLGWGGARRAHLRRVLEFYTDELGLDAVSHAMPLRVNEAQREEYARAVGAAIRARLPRADGPRGRALAGQGQGQGQLGQGVAAGAPATALPDDETGCQPTPRLVFHIFSNNGTWTYARLVRQALRRGSTPTQEEPLPLGEAGSHVRIFDSAPGLWTEELPLLANARLFSRAILPSLLGRLQHEHAVVTPLLVPALALWIAWSVTLLLLFRLLFFSTLCAPSLLECWFAWYTFPYPRTRARMRNHTDRLIYLFTTTTTTTLHLLCNPPGGVRVNQAYWSVGAGCASGTESRACHPRRFLFPAGLACRAVCAGKGWWAGRGRSH